MPAMRASILAAMTLLVLLAACTPPAPTAPPPAPPATGGLTLDTSQLGLAPEHWIITPEEAAQRCGLTRSYGGLRGDQNETTVQTFQDTAAPYGRLIFEFKRFPTEDAARKSFLRAKRDLVNLTELGPNYATGLLLDADGNPFRRHYVFQDGTVRGEAHLIPWLTCTQGKTEELISLARERLNARAA
jgi:hypothetical protein